MMKSIQKTLIAASVGAVLAAGSMAAQAADNVLFPYITTKAGAYTFISLQNNGAALATTDKPYHFYYMTKPIGSANSAGCNHFDAIGTTTANDLGQFEIRKRVDLKAQFGDTTTTPIYHQQDNHEGFLIVSNDTPVANLNFHGEAVVVDSSSGLFYAYSSSGLVAAPNAGDPNYSDAAITDATATKVSTWYPDSAVTTRWYIVPTGLRSGMADVAGGGLTATLTANTAGITGGGAYDNNETPFSGTSTPAVTCFGFVTRSQYLQPGTAAATANGGWMNSSRTGGTSSGFLQYKIQNTTALGAQVTTISRDTAL